MSNSLGQLAMKGGKLQSQLFNNENKMGTKLLFLFCSSFGPSFGKPPSLFAGELLSLRDENGPGWQVSC
jgi:hypothetical protein